jgi:hypothetical protein
MLSKSLPQTLDCPRALCRQIRLFSVVLLLLVLAIDCYILQVLRRALLTIIYCCAGGGNGFKVQPSLDVV